MESSPAIDSASSTVTKPMNGEELAHQLLSTLSVDFSIPPSSLLAAARDRASVNNVAIRHLKILPKPGGHWLFQSYSLSCSSSSSSFYY